MKKLLLSLAVVLGLMPAVNANAGGTITEKWVYASEQFGAGWDGTAPNWSSTDAIKSKSCARFATAANGKIYTVNMKTMSIAEVTADGLKDLYKLPSLEGRSVDINGTATPDYYGTSIAIDQAGNFLVGHYFTKAQSVLYYTLYSPATGKYKHIELNVPDGMQVMRNDCMGRILGDMTKSAYAYIAPGDFVQAGGVVTPGSNGGGTSATNQKVRVLTFAGEGDAENVTVTDQWSGMIYLGSHNAYDNICVPVYSSMEAAKDVPATSTFMSASAYQSGNPNTDQANTKPVASYFGFLPTGGENWGYVGLNSTIAAATNGFDTFVLNGHRYYVRNHMAEYSIWHPNTMDIAVYDEAFNIVATWNNPDYQSQLGYSTIVAEPVSDTVANIYVYNSTTKVFDESKDWGAAAMLEFTVTEDPDGTAEHPYQIATPADLCDMHNKIVAGTKVYFVMTDDIDMTGVTDYVPAIGAPGTTESYYGEFEFDGQNHVISNFAPAANYSYMSLFGVIRGDVKNLGVENATIIGNSLGAGILGGYGSHGGIDCVIENVWATGTVTGNGVYAGGLVGTNANNLTIKNSYFKGDVNAKFAGGLVGRARAGVTIENSYAAGEITGSANAGGIAGTDKDASVAITLNNVIAWNTSVTCATAANAVTTLGYDAATVKVWDGMTVNGAAVENGTSAADLAATATAWAAYKDATVAGFPVLAWQTFPAGSEGNPYIIATADDLCDMHNKIAANTATTLYFELANDIDMTGVTDYVPAIGSDGVNYAGSFMFDGKNHVIRNFKPAANYSYMSLFGVIRGDVKNLGVENAEVTAGGSQPVAAILGGYGSHGTFNCTIENVWATGNVTSASSYAGGLIGTNGSNGLTLTIKNCYFQGNVTAKTFGGGLVGRARAGISIENAYATGTVTAESNAGGIAGTDKDASVAIALNNVVAWNTTVTCAAAANAVTTLSYDAATVKVWDGMKVNDAAVTDGVANEELITFVSGLEGFKALLYNGYPALKNQYINTGLGTAAAPYTISTPEELAGLKDAFANVQADAVSYIALGADIDMTDVTYPLNSVKNKGIIYFDGKNHIISNLTMTGQAALFADFTGTIKNTGMVDVNFTGGAAAWAPCGAFMTYANGESVLENCFATGNIEGFYAAGLVGGVNNNSKLTIKNCYFQGDVLGDKWGYAGALVGAVNGNTELNIENAYATGTLKPGANAGANAGGICGGINPGYAGGVQVINLKNCYALETEMKFVNNYPLVVPNDALTVNVEDCGYLASLKEEGGITKEEAFDAIVELAGFQHGLFNEYPALAWQKNIEGFYVNPDGVGGENNPIVIATAEDLVALSAKNAMPAYPAYFVFDADIDMTDVLFAQAIEPKYEIYVDGQGHIIKNLEITYGRASLFGNVQGGYIKNLGLENANVTAASWGLAAPLASYAAAGELTVDNCFATGNATGYFASGLIGGVQKGASLVLTNSYSRVEMKAAAQAGLSGGLVGGLMQSGKVTVENCYAYGTVANNGTAAGIVGGMNTYLAELETYATLKNVVAWTSAIKGGATDTFVVAADLLKTTIEGAEFWEELKINNKKQEGGKTTEELQALVTSWEAFADELDEAGLPILEWQANKVPTIEIATVDDLLDLVDEMPEYPVNIVFTADIDFSSDLFAKAIEPKAEIYVDGKNHVISNLTVTAGRAALFGNVQGGYIKNLGMENVNAASDQWGLAGTLAAYSASGELVVDNCYATGEVTGYYSSGLVAGVQTGASLVLTNSYAKVTVNSTANGGGLVGAINKGGAATIENCYFAGDIKASNQAGGIVAGMNTYLADVEATLVLNNVVSWAGKVQAAAANAFACEFDLFKTEYTNAYAWDGMKVNGKKVEDAKTAEELQTIITAWDAYNEVIPEDGYPVLKWQTVTSDAVEDINAESTVAPVYYNLQGVRVENPSAGLYIIKQGNKVYKAIVR